MKKKLIILLCIFVVSSIVFLGLSVPYIEYNTRYDVVQGQIISEKRIRYLTTDSMTERKVSEVGLEDSEVNIGDNYGVLLKKGTQDVVKVMKRSDQDKLIKNGKTYLAIYGVILGILFVLAIWFPLSRKILVKKSDIELF